MFLSYFSTFGFENNAKVLGVNESVYTSDTIYVENISLDKTEVSVPVNEIIELTATVLPSNATNKKVIWTSSDTSVVVVSNDGMLKGYRPGSATVVVKTEDGAKTASCKITVYQPVTGILLNQTSVKIKEFESKALSWTVFPSDATNKNVSFTSSDSSVATVSESGIVSAVNKGSAVITVISSDGSYRCTCSVTVTPHSHSYSEKITKEATCIKSGIKTYTCFYCEDSYAETIPEKGHDSDDGRVIKSATCTESGERIFSCTVCGGVISKEIISALGHVDNVGMIISVPTCEQSGKKTYKCVNCGEYTKTEELSALGHAWDEGTEIVASTCKTHGEKLYICKNDSNHKKTEQTDFNSDNHEGGIYIKNAINSTCVSNGYTGDNYCKGCDVKVSSGEEVEKLSHTYEVITTKASLVQNGKIESKCIDCGDIESISEIAYPETIKLSSTEITYNGRVRTPSIIIKDSQDNFLVKGRDYEAFYEGGRKLPGKYAITVNFKGNYEGIKILTFTILPKIPATISATQSTSVIKLTWSASTGATGYRVYQYSPSKGKYVVIASVKGVTTYRKSTNLKPGTTYKFKIKPYTKLSDGTVLWGDASDAFVTATECKAPKITAITSPATSKATVKWTNVSGETGYQLYYATSKNGTYKKIKSYGVNTVTGSKTFSSSASGKTIYFKVRAYSKVNGQTIFSEWSAVKSVKLK